MRFIVILAILFLVFSTYVKAEECGVSGIENESGLVEGKVDTEPGSTLGEGYVYDDEGIRHEVDTIDTGDGEIEGHDQEGNRYDMDPEG